MKPIIGMQCIQVCSGVDYAQQGPPFSTVTLTHCLLDSLTYRQNRDSRLSTSAGARRRGDHHLLRLPRHHPPKCEVHAEPDRHGVLQVRAHWQDVEPGQVSQCLESRRAFGGRAAVPVRLHGALLSHGGRVRVADGASADRNSQGDNMT